MHNYVADFFSQLSKKRVYITLFLFTWFYPAFAYDFYVGGHFYAITGEHTVEIEKCSYIIGDIVIPEQIEYGGITYTVTSIGIGAFANWNGSTLVTIPNSVTSIGHDALTVVKD